MIQHSFLNPLEKALRFFAGLALATVLFQLTGLLMYVNNVWPSLRGTVSQAQVVFICIAIALLLVRSMVWIRIYWEGAGAFSILGGAEDSPETTDRLALTLTSLTRLLVASCVLDLLFLPAFFLTDAFLPFSISGWRLGALELARLLFPQAFGLAALILAFLTHQFGQVLRERSKMKNELELTI